MNLASREYCTGCAACVNACQVNALTMIADAEGFLQPVVNTSKCVSCGACERVCPILPEAICAPMQVEKKPLCGVTTNEGTWRLSTSGGAFTEICNTLSAYDPVVFGARYKLCDQVEIGCVESLSEIGDFRKSKYVQADMGLAMRKCRDYLNAGRHVIFSGTPCQIAGLRSYLRKDYENLLTIEFICHGVGSPKVFSDSLKAMASVFRGKMATYGFRSKIKRKIKEEHSSVHVIQLGRWLKISRIVACDLYNRFFLRQLCLRRSCMEHCHFRNSARYADITLADCRDEQKLYPHADGRNWSVIVANTARGVQVVGQIGTRMTLKDYPLDFLERTNPLYFRTTKGNESRGVFFARWQNGESLWKIAKDLAPDPRDRKVRYMIACCWHLLRRLLALKFALCLTWCGGTL